MILWLSNFYLQAGISETLFEELLHFVSIVADKRGGPFASMYLFKKYLSEISPMETSSVYLFCKMCRAPILREICGTRCLECQTNLDVNCLMKEGFYFINSPLELAIKNTLEIADVEKAMLEYRASVKGNLSHMRDVHDSDAYKEIEANCEEKFQKSSIPFITIMVNIDGVEVSRSSKRSLYPVQLVINELPPHVRAHFIIVPMVFMKTEYVDFDDRLMRVFMESIQLLNCNGVQWKSSNTGEMNTTKVVIYSYNLDAMMKPKILGIAHPTGYNACPGCFSAGTYIKKSKRGGSVAHLSNDPGALVKRTMENMVVGECGQRNSTIFIEMSGNRDIFKMIPVDSLHNGYLGNVKYLLKRFFDESARGRAFRNVADEIITDTRPPNFIERGPRQFGELANWKANEFGNFLFYLSIPIFDELFARDLMSLEQRLHWTYFVEGIFLLNSDEISLFDINTSQQRLSAYHASMAEVYGAEYCTYNLHCATHMPDHVEELGPLWSISMFMFESFNSTIIRSFNGTNNVPLQIAQRLNMRRPLLLLTQDIQNTIPESFSLQNALFSFRPKAELIVQKEKPLSARDRKTITEFCGTFEGFRSYGYVYLKGLKLSTWAHDHQDSITKKCNCYMFSKAQQEFGQIEKLLVKDNSRVFIIYRAISGEDAEVRYCKKNCTVAKVMKIEEWIENYIIPCIRVKVRTKSGFYIMRRINKSYSS